MWTSKQKTARRARGLAGYTVVELMMGMAVSAIVAGVSMPNMLDVIQRHRSDMAPRQVKSDLRFAQAQAIALGMEARLAIFDAAGKAPGAGYADDGSKANQYRVELRPTGGAWPALTDDMRTNGNVLTPWLDLRADYRQSVAQATAVVFNSRGALQNSAVSLNIVLDTVPGGASRTVRTYTTGLVEIL